MLRMNEGNSICVGKERNTLINYVPPMIFNTLGCQSLPNSTQKVKQFEHSGWDEMEGANANFYLDCNVSLGQLYLIFETSQGKKELHVYKKF